MVFTPVDPVIKEKVLAKYLAGYGRNQIDRELRKEGAKISHGSISNIISAYKKKHEQLLQSDATISMGININNTDGSSFLSGTELAVTTNSKPDVIPKNGGPLSHFLGDDSTDDAESNLQSPPKPETIKDQVNIEPDDKSLPQSPTLQPVKSIATADTQPQQQKANVNVTSEDLSLLQKPPKKPGRTFNNRESEIEARFEKEKIAWEYYGQAQTRILNLIRREKDQRRHELIMINLKEGKFKEWERRLLERESNLNDRENRVFEVEPFLAEAKQLQNLGIGMEEAFHWFEIIREKAEAEKIDHKTSAIKIARELRLYRLLESVQKQIERANQELALVEMTTIKKRQVITVLEDLLNKGMTESQIIQLGEGNKWTSEGEGNFKQPVNGINNPIACNIQQPNNGSSSTNNGQSLSMSQYLMDSFYGKYGINNPGGSKDNGNIQQPCSSNPGDGNNGYGVSFSINDLIRLNLLKNRISTTTNMLNRMSPQ